MNDKQMKADQLQERLLDFAVRIIKLSSKLPKNLAGRHIASQILRSGTSPPPNYGEARAASSHADFLHHLSIVLRELNETLIWLQMIRKGALLPPEKLSDLIDENQQLCRIITASIKTARSDLAMQARSTGNG
jgi:four helix bundle protein